MFRSRSTPASGNPGDVPLERSGSGLTWVYAGTAASALALLGAAAWTFNVLGAVSVMPGKPALTIHVIGHQWWWEFRYEGDDVSRSFTTANEIHIPTGQPVRIEATSTDVIHSFWVPTLSGKMDTIPNQHNETWIEADTPGTYRGQCTEFCGQQHAHMALIAIADPPDKFKAWWDDQLKPAPAPPSDTIAQGRSAFVARCGVCHAVRGSIAQGRLGPDLSHLMSRSTIAAGTLPNTVGYLSGWIADPQHAKPGNLMPELDLSGPELTVIRRYLETLK
jgi:cytochrome c oxidase subunit 2